MDIRTDFSLEVSQISKFQVQMSSLDEKCVRNSQLIPKCVIFDLFFEQNGWMWWAWKSFRSKMPTSFQWITDQYRIAITFIWDREWFMSLVNFWRIISNDGVFHWIELESSGTVSALTLVHFTGVTPILTTNWTQLPLNLFTHFKLLLSDWQPELLEPCWSKLERLDSNWPKLMVCFMLLNFLHWTAASTKFVMTSIIFLIRNGFHILSNHWF